MLHLSFALIIFKIVTETISQSTSKLTLFKYLEQSLSNGKCLVNVRHISNSLLK